MLKYFIIRFFCLFSFHSKSLYWLPVRFRIDYKVLLLVFKPLNGLGLLIYLSYFYLINPHGL